MKLYHKALSCLLAISLGETAVAQSAQTEQEHWYAVEVIAFKRLQINQNELPLNMERLNLSYPKNSMSVLEADTIADMSARQHADSQAQTETASNLPDANPNPDSTPPLTEVQREKELIPGHFVVSSPRAEEGLKRQAGSLARSKNQRVLFHKRWNLQLPPQQKQFNIVIHGGERFGDHQELEGYIQLSRSRYLHIETNIWLSQFGFAQEEDYGRWLSLPERPSPFREVAVDNNRLENNEFVWQGQNSDTFTNNDSGSSLSNSPGNSLNNYVVRSIEQLKQKRRMRSGEIHYIDHPAFGLLIQLTPIEAPVWPYDNRLLPSLPAQQSAPVEEQSTAVISNPAN
ncbi:CsiV family protein [Pseudoteredinibacter isoporae]|uniref:Peptidoglycan-binding protein CsiV n=1 Tax=Pseudoteredinibacter isoporae TaxID=570281 RepID=A0A7X0JT26_9GAMM|nr:CsiV family protein [Pseudoteredinibacter isoporae]MBB6521724.1 hypothetical protein [Pseudoteredinibacter isoporae]NHO87272.1 hypothetical protein [Pseudoteredinibacter isoporae]NIB23096.1 hypothetical protein [Pseudoteredinibacter isoporae]